MAAIGTAERPAAVAIVGSGPSGLYALEALLKSKDFTFRVDVFDRLPTPYGLVRGGVAPDHQKIKSVIAVYEKIAADPRVRFFGGVKIGENVLASELRARYDMIVYAAGCESDRHMDIPGEDFKGSHPATQFVGWYNNHPDHFAREFDLSCGAVAVVGVGNVAMDVTRLLVRDPAELSKTDISDAALAALQKSKVSTVYLLGRRGPAQAAFSLTEIKEIAELSSADLVVRPDEAADAGNFQKEGGEAVKKVEFLRAQAARGEGGKAKKVFARFCVSPVEILGKNGRVTGLKLEKNKLVDDGKGGVKAVGTGQFEEISVGMVLRSVGYRGIPIPDVAFDEKSGHIPNANGRVLGAGGAVEAGEYVVGWAKRGPSGLIGTNRADSVATVAAMFDDLKADKFLRAASAADAQSIVELLAEKNIHYVNFTQWKTIDKAEVARGAKTGKIREKFTRIEEMLKAAGA